MRCSLRSFGLAIFVLFISAAVCHAQAPEAGLSGEDREAIVLQVTEGLMTTYIFLDDAEAMAETLAENLEAGAYDEYDEVQAFCERLTADLHSVRRDLHLAVRPSPQRSTERSPEEAAEAERVYAESLKRSNYGFSKLEILSGNVGYLRLDGFEGAERGGDTAVAAMNFLANVDALIFDLRFNGGGEPSMIQLLTSYLLDEVTHLNSFYVRETDEIRQFWTQAHVDGPNLTSVPVYVLTSSNTFSGAEEFTYNLKHLERATIVGQTTGGGAHPVQRFQVEGYPIAMSLPFGRAVNPITKSNWEGTGVTPHMEAAVEEALDRAHLEALDAVAEQATDPTQREELKWAREELAATLEPVVLESGQMEAYVGVYGPRRIWIQDGTLTYARAGGSRATALVPLSEDRFMLTGVTGFRLSFERDDDGRVNVVVGRYVGGRSDRHERSAD